MGCCNVRQEKGCLLSSAQNSSNHDCRKARYTLFPHQAIQSIRRESKLKVQLQVTLFLHLNFMWENLGHLNSKFRSGHGQEREHVGFQLQIHREKVGTYSSLVIFTRYGHQIHCQCRCTSYPPTHIFIGCVCVCVRVCETYMYTINSCSSSLNSSCTPSFSVEHIKKNQQLPPVFFSFFSSL